MTTLAVDRRYPIQILLVSGAIFLLALALAAGRGAAPGAPTSAATPLTSIEEVERWQRLVAASPDSALLQARLGLATLALARESADPAYYALGERALDGAIALDPDQREALLGQGLLALARHDFDRADALGHRLRATDPYFAPALGLLVDAAVEQGRYEEAISHLETMIALHPDLSAFTRVSYIRELHGDVAGAIEAMERALSAGRPGSEPWLWSLVQLGTLHFGQGDLDRAARRYDEALWHRPDYPPALAGRARVLAARGDPDGAAALYEEVVARRPDPGVVIEAGELYESMNRVDEAARKYALVRAMMGLSESAGMNVDLEMALFDAQHGADPAAALARAEAAYAARPGVHAADTLAWALLAAGESERALQLSREALGLGGRDAAMHYRAGRIALAAGEQMEGLTLLREALDINPHFSPLHAPQARRILEASQGN